MNDGEKLFSLDNEEVETKAFGSVSIVEDAVIVLTLKIEKGRYNKITETHFGGYYFSIFSCVGHDRE